MLTQVLVILFDWSISNWKPFQCFHDDLPKAHVSCRLRFPRPWQLIFYLFMVLPFQELRVELDKLLRQKIAQPEMKLSAGTGADNKESALLRAIIDLITSEENTNWVRDRHPLSLSLAHSPSQDFSQVRWNPVNPVTKAPQKCGHIYGVAFLRWLTTVYNTFQDLYFDGS